MLILTSRVTNNSDWLCNIWYLEI